MPPNFALIEKTLGETERAVAHCVETYVTEHSLNDPDYDPDSIVEDIEETIRAFLDDLNCSLQSQPRRNAADNNAYDEIRRRTISMIQNTKDRLIEVGCAEDNLDDWFSGYLREQEDQ